MDVLLTGFALVALAGLAYGIANAVLDYLGGNDY